MDIDTILYESGCCDSWSSRESEVDGICSECNMPTAEGVAAYGCNCSPKVCNTCGYRPCDGSC